MRNATCKMFKEPRFTNPVNNFGLILSTKIYGNRKMTNNWLWISTYVKGQTATERDRRISHCLFVCFQSWLLCRSERQNNTKLTRQIRWCRTRHQPSPPHKPTNPKTTHTVHDKSARRILQFHLFWLSAKRVLTGVTISALLHQVSDVLQLKIEVSDEPVEQLSY